MDREKLDEIIRSLDELKAQRAAKPKDFWDKSAVIGQLVSGILIAIVGYFVTTALNHGQTQTAQTIAAAQIASAANLADRQNDLTKSTTTDQLTFQRFSQRSSLDATNRQIVGDYFGKFAALTVPTERAQFLDVLDVELGPDYSVPLAVRQLKPLQIRDEICKGKIVNAVATNKLLIDDAIVRRAATDLLDRLRDKGRRQLFEISKSGFQPDAGIADAFLRRGPKVQYQVSEIDDFADIYLNNQKIATYQFGQESGWNDISSKLIKGKDNSFHVIVRNSPYEGTGVRLEMKIGEYQYDRHIERYDWTGEGPAFDIGMSIPTNNKGDVTYNGDNVQSLGNLGFDHCNVDPTLR